MSIERFGSGGPWGARVGYGRAQTRQACPNVVAALALTMVEVRALIDERMVVEIDATAFVG